MNLQQRFADKFRKPKKLDRKQQEKQERAEKFIKEYTELCKEHKLQWDIAYEFNHREGLRARFVLIEHREPESETKDWEECKKENKEIRKKEEEKKSENNNKENANPDNR